MVVVGRQLRSSGGFVLDLRLVEGALSVPSVGVVVFYLNGVLAFSLHDWRVFTQSIGLYVAVLSVAGDFVRRRWWQPIRAHLDARAAERSDPALALAAFAAAMDLPRRFLVFHLGAWTLAGVVGAAGMAGWSGREWSAFESFTVLLAGITGGVVAGGFVFFGLRLRLAGLRALLAQQVPDPRERNARVRRVSLRTKLLLTVASSGLASVLFAGLFAYASASNGMLRVIGDWQARALLAASGSAAAGAIADASSPAAAQAPGAPVTLVRFDPAASEEPPAALGRPLGAEIAGRVAQGAAEGTLRREGRIATWSRVADGSILVALTPAAALESFLRSVARTIALFLGLAAGVSMVLVVLFARDVDHATRALTESAQRLAKGELRHGEPFESEDELGQLARTYQETADALRALVGDVASAALRVDGAAVDLQSVSQRVAGGADEQAREMGSAAAAMEDLYERVQRLSGAASDLTTSMDVAGDSIERLGSAGEQLRDTAGLLAGNADAVSTSVEELVRSSRGVAESSETLGTAASETSRRMDLMANAMRVVNAAAEKMAELVAGVQRSAEAGRTRVGETSQGIAEIQRATETAGRVVDRLVASAKEISTVLEVIDEVADETNLLALNAAVIAAQAGEHGRPFAVVADHVRELAGRVLASTGEIDALTRALQDESSRAASAIEHGMQSVSAGVERAAQAGLSLDEIAAAAGETGAFTRQIVTAVGEQTEAAAEVVQLMARVLTGVERIAGAENDRARGNERIASAARSMLEVAHQVRATTQEQARGHSRITQASGEVRDVAEGMNAAMQEQTAACAEIARVLERVVVRTRETSGEAQTMAGAVKRLADEAERLRQQTRRFEL
jgi:methyl-accepting chemotaxis protein